MFITDSWKYALTFQYLVPWQWVVQTDDVQGYILYICDRNIWKEKQLLINRQFIDVKCDRNDLDLWSWIILGKSAAFSLSVNINEEKYWSYNQSRMDKILVCDKVLQPW